jgi:osmotically inducible protein OsmC
LPRSYGSIPLKAFTGKASVIWTGNHKRGKGAITTPSTVLTRARYGSGLETRRQATHPSELIAAAHAASFSMTLADELAIAGYVPGRIDTTATVTTEYAAARWTMAQIHLEIVAAVRKIEQSEFVDATLRAKLNCPVSRLVTANISMQARLDH